MNRHISYSAFRKELKNNMEQVTNDREILEVTRVGAESVVVVPKEDFEAMEETIYLLGSKTNAEALTASILQAQNGEFEEVVLD